MTCQEVYVKHKIPASDTRKIAEKLGIARNEYTPEQVDAIAQIYNAAKVSGLSLVTFLAGFEVDAPAQSPTSSSAQAATTPEEFQQALTTTATTAVNSATDLLAKVNQHFGQMEQSVADAVADRIAESPARAARMTMEKLKNVNPQFFRIAPEGASLPTFTPARTEVSYLTAAAQTTDLKKLVHSED